VFQTFSNINVYILRGSLSTRVLLPNFAFDSDAVQRYALHGAGQRER
jgi:hypothetical protein